MLIVGAGCAGLSLAAHLRTSEMQDRRIDVLDERTCFGKDRTWCFFNVEGHLFSRRGNPSMAPMVGRRPLARGYGSTAAEFAYEHLPADAFYKRALELIRPEDDGISPPRHSSAIDPGPRRPRSGRHGPGRAPLSTGVRQSPVPSGSGIPR